MLLSGTVDFKTGILPAIKRTLHKDKGVNSPRRHNNHYCQKFIEQQKEIDKSTVTDRDF